MVPIDHSRLHSKNFGGKPSDYLKIDKWIDQTKFAISTWQHRCWLHNTMGVKLCEDFFGDVIINSDGNEIPVREIARQHIMQDLGRVPTLQDWIEGIRLYKMETWMNNPNKKDLQYLKENYYDRPKTKKNNNKQTAKKIS